MKSTSLITLFVKLYNNKKRRSLKDVIGKKKDRTKFTQKKLETKKNKIHY